MKVAIDKTTWKIIDRIPNMADESYPFLIKNDYALLEVENPYKEDGSFRDLTDDEVAPILKKAFKANRELLVSQIEVEYNGHIYQGDETSQDRMSRAINGMEDEDTITWRAKNNRDHLLTKIDLKSILREAGQKQTKLWVKD